MEPLQAKLQAPPTFLYSLFRCHRFHLYHATPETQTRKWTPATACSKSAMLLFVGRTNPL